MGRVQRSHKPLARLPLQIGTTAAWGAARAAISLFPALGLIGLGVLLFAHELGNDAAELGAWPCLVGLLLLVYGLIHLWGAVKNRASDLLLFPSGVHIDGGRLHGAHIPWDELSPPFAEVEETHATRLTLWRIFLFVFSLAARSRTIASPLAPVDVWRLWIWRRGQRQLVAETDREIEAESMEAAAASISAVEEGRRYVAEAPAIAAQITTCARCGAPAIPDDAPAVPCKYCGGWVQLPPHVRGQAAAAKAMQHSRARTAKMVAKLLDQPRAATSNFWLLFFTMMMFGAWPVGWGLAGYRIFENGWQIEDVAFLCVPFAAVLSGFFFARGRLADRGALQLLTLGFGALAPSREGEPSRCRRCQAPLPDAGIGGVTQCRYCHSENIVGLDLRPTVDQHRAEAATFDEALKRRGREKALWTALTILAVIVLLIWAGGTAVYVAGML
jgi:ribosomal protein L40E